MSENSEGRFDDLLKQMVQGEAPSEEKKRKVPKEAKHKPPERPE
jgi:hypothetical protein